MGKAEEMVSFLPTLQSRTSFGGLHRRFYSMDSKDLQILAEIHKHGPSNITAIAREMNVATSTVSRRLNNLAKSVQLQILTNLAYHKLGIRRTLLEIEPSVADESEAMKRVFSLNYWFQCYKILGKRGYSVGFKIPYALFSTYESIFKGLQEVLSLKMSIHPLGDIAGTGPSFNGYDPQGKRWSIGWEEIKEKLTEGEPLTLNDPPSYEIEVDSTDVVILLCLESDASMSLSKIAIIAGVSIPTVSNRIRKLTENGLILGYVTNLLPFPTEDSRLIQLFAGFPGENEMGRFATGLLRMPFLLSFQKQIGQDALLARMHIPNPQFASFSNLLDELTSEHFMTSFEIVELDPYSERLSKISPELFSSKSQWKFKLREEAG